MMKREDFLSGPVSVTAYDWVPGLAQGYVRDLRLRWALEEAGFPYDADLLPLAERASASNLTRQPFGQVPAMQVGDLSMFESGACAWRIAEASDVLLPDDATERQACFSWFFAALDSLGQPIDRCGYLRYFAEDREAAERIEPQARDFLRLRLSRLADALGDRPFLVGGRFTIADLMMSVVLRNAETTGDLDAFPALGDYVRRNTGRPAFQRAMEAQMQPFRKNAAKYEPAG
ncbi:MULTISPECIES: glutathione S-transferase family protein [unclassified Aureimonas]|uniref:glutathione S-transferase family protein n=1 Tax=unclassified Aureimonas TaxID=2615206 RepID=UPI001FCD51E4|nr:MULTISPECIES: glutathione S-transferase family protein [unclassified Aureimonas]